MKSCAVIIAAFDCPDYINECVESVQRQLKSKDWKYDIRIGVDGCKKTSRACTVPHYYSPVNRGAYVMRNSLIYMRSADVFSYFDADDIMAPNYLSLVLDKISRGSDAVVTSKWQCDNNMTPINIRYQHGGAITFTRRALEAVGGFKSYRCAADSDFMNRLEMAGYKIDKINAPLYYRRLHNKSLTKSPQTSYNSEYRKRAWSYMTVDRNNGVIQIIPEIHKLEWREK
jgi:glycosyltransferase involved in cell wall biosynthesis